MRMRNSLSLAILAASLLSPSGLMAQEPAQAPAGPTADATANVAEFTGRGTLYDAGSDQARYQRYRDLRDGGTLDVFRFTKTSDSQWFNVQADHVGYRDQRFSVGVNDYGKVKASFEFNQIPLLFSETTQTPYTTSSILPGVFRLDDSIQAGQQNKTATFASIAGLAQPFDVKLQRSIADFKGTYSASRYLDLTISLKSSAKTGNQPWAGTFGFSDAVELPVPVQTRTTDLGLGIEWANRRGSARLGYDGSFFRNDISTLVWDNPLRLTDSPTAGPLQGRMSLWPDSNLNAVSATGLLNLPARSRATAYISVGDWSQNDPLIPFSVNSTLPSIPLDRQTADAQARVTSMNYSFNSRPADAVSLTARYRSYDFDNRTPVFHVTNTIAYDTTVEAFTDGGTSPYSVNRKTFDAEVSLTPFKYSGLRAGYTREQISETFRSFDMTTEDTWRVSADTMGLSWMMLRAVYEHAKRVGSGFNEVALDDIGEQVSLRQFDFSDRTTNRVSGIVQVTPVSALSFNAMVSAGNEDYPSSMLGLQSNDNRGYSVGVDYVPRQAVSMGLNYEFERYTTLQASREANPGAQFTDPTRNWTTSGADKAGTFTASMDLLKAWPKTDIRLAYDYSHAESTYVYGLAPNSTIPPVVQLPTVMNQLQRGTLDVRYHLTSHFAAGLVYWYDKYSVNDFALGAATLTSIAQPSFLMIGYLDRPYTASTVSGRFTYYW